MLCILILKLAYLPFLWFYWPSALCEISLLTDPSLHPPPAHAQPFLGSCLTEALPISCPGLFYLWVFVLIYQDTSAAFALTGGCSLCTGDLRPFWGTEFPLHKGKWQDGESQCLGLGLIFIFTGNLELGIFCLLMMLRVWTLCCFICSFLICFYFLKMF